MAQEATPTPKAMLPAEMTTAGPYRAISRPAMPNDAIGTIAGPGARARPACNADQRQTPCSQSTTDSSIAPKDAEKLSAISEAPLNRREANNDGWISGLELRRQCATNSAINAPAPTRVSTTDAEPHPQSPPLTRPRVSAATPPVTSTTPSGSGRSMVWPGTRGRRRTDDQRSDADRNVDQKHPAPTRRDEQPTDHRADRRCRAADRRPRANSAVPPIRCRGGQHEAERGRCQQRGTRSLHQPECDECSDVRRRGTGS